MSTNLLELNRKVINRQANGQTIWQPRIGAWLDDMVFRGEELPGKFAGCGHSGIFEKIGCSDRLYQFNNCLEQKYDDSVKVIRNEMGNRTFQQIIETPIGRVNQIMRGNSSNPGHMPIKWFIETLEDLKVYTYIEEATTFSFNMDTYNRLYTELSHLGLPTIFVPRTNIQKLLIELSGVEDTFNLLSDYEDEVEDYFKALSKSQESAWKILAESPIEWINYGDNLHCKILPPYMFEKYILPEYEKRGDFLHRGGKFLYSHWDGEVKDILPYAKTCFLDGIEAITPIPQGDVTLEEVKSALGDEIFLVDGIAALLFNETYPIEQLKEQTEKVLELFEGQLVLGISDEFPSDGKLEKIEYVNDIVNEFNAKR